MGDWHHWVNRESGFAASRVVSDRRATRSDNLGSADCEFRQIREFVVNRVLEDFAVGFQQSSCVDYAAETGVSEAFRSHNMAE